MDFDVRTLYESPKSWTSGVDQVCQLASSHCSEKFLEIERAELKRLLFGGGRYMVKCMRECRIGLCSESI